MPILHRLRSRWSPTRNARADADDDDSDDDVDDDNGADDERSAGTVAAHRTDDTHSDAGDVWRVRIDVPGLFGDPAVAARLERALGRRADVWFVRASTQTGRALIGARSPQSAAAVRLAAADLIDHEAPAPPSLVNVLRSARRRTAEAVQRSRKLIRRSIRSGQTTNGHAREVPSWHAMTPDQVMQALTTSATWGLSPSRADQLLHLVGPNQPAGVAGRSAAEIVAGQVLTVPTALLGAGVVLSLSLGDIVEASAIALVVGANVAVGYFAEARAEELLQAWRGLSASRARVIRGGRDAEISPSVLVPGDVLLLRAGDPIAADARVIAASDLTIDESTLTGESEPVEKSSASAPQGALLADRCSMVYAGTVVSTGDGRAVVVATGRDTELGSIEGALLGIEQQSVPLDRQLGQLGRTLGALAVVSAASVVGLGVLRGRPTRALAQNAVALAVAAIPEGLPSVGTTALALASRRLRRSGIVIRRLAAAETLGALSVACIDKTGTLTQNRMQVAELWLPEQGPIKAHWDDEGRLTLRSASGREIDPGDVRELARIAALNADVDVTDAGEIVNASGTEQALVAFALALGYPVKDRRRRARRLREQRRSATMPLMVTVHEHPELGIIKLAKGAPEATLSMCANVTPRLREEALAQNQAMASHGLRVLAFAWSCGGGAESHSELELEGLIGLRDPPRPEARQALAAFESAGIRTYMLTGDQERTALAIGAELGIPAARIRSRITSNTKLAIVRELSREGNVVAMTGDGVNDGPALAAADVGVAMGARGTDVARAVADVVLETDDLASLTAAVREGRTLYDNVRRAIGYLVSTNMSEVMVMLAGALLGIDPLGPLQLLWLNLLTDVAPALALAVEPSEGDVMRRPPRDANAALFERRDYVRMGREAGWMASTTLLSYGLGVRSKGERYARTMAFVSLITSQLLHVERWRSHASRPHPKLAAVLAGSLAAQGIALGSDSLRKALDNAELEGSHLALALLLGLAPSIGSRLTGKRESRRFPGEIVIERGMSQRHDNGAERAERP